MRALALRSYTRCPPRGAWPVLAALLVAGCGPARTIQSDVELRLSDATSCRPPQAIDRVVVRALGDGRAGEAAIVELGPDTGGLFLPDLAVPTQAVLARAEGGGGWEALGYRALGDRGVGVLLQPPGLSCGIADPEARAPDGAAIATMADGAIAIAGGLDRDGVASRRVVLLAPGASRVEMAPVQLSSATAFASATATPDGRMLIAGGAIDEGASAFGEYEDLDPDDPEARVVAGTLADRRRDHSAILLRDGRVLIAGGRSSGDGEPLVSIEIVDRELRRGVRARSAMVAGRIAPILTLDDRGRVWIAGGDAAAPSIERFDPSDESIERFAIDGVGPADALAVLPGGRLAWIVRDEGVGTETTHVILLREEGARVVRAESSAPIVQGGRAIATPGGRVLVVGRGAGALRDPSRGASEPRTASIAPTALAVLGDRAIAEIAPAGAALRREDEPTPYEDPPATIVPALDDAWVLLDPTGIGFAEPSFHAVGSELVADVAGARIDVRALRARRLEITLLVEGAVDLVLVPEDAPELAITVAPAEVRVGDCMIERVEGSIAIEGGRVTHGERSCEVEDRSPYGIALRAREADVVVRGIRIARR